MRARGLSVLRVLGVASTYYVAANIDVFTSPLAGPISSLWIPTGVALACLVTFGLRNWTALGIAIGALASSLPDLPASAAVLVTLGNTCAPVSAYLLLRLVGFREELDRLKDALSLVLLGAFAATTISATLGTVAIIGLTDQLDAGFLQVWAVWWSSDALGVLVVTPFILVLPRLRLARRVAWGRWLEMSILLSATLAISVAATRSFGLLFLAFPLVILAAWRFQLPGVAPCTLIVSAVAIDAAAHGYGLFEGRTLLANIAILQVFNGTIVLTGLLLAVVITEWRSSRAAIEHTMARLSDAVDQLQGSMLSRPHYLMSLQNISQVQKRTATERSAWTSAKPSTERS